MPFKAVELFSGIGSFAEACRLCLDSNDRVDIQVIAAYDQNTHANAVYKHNFGLAPSTTNLDSISLKQIPDADIWWMSPPCTPYSVRGKKADIADPRAKSFLQLLSCLESKRPRLLFLENVRGFQNSLGHRFLRNTLARSGYAVSEVQLCATDFGTPMRRPRYFVIGELLAEPVHTGTSRGSFDVLNQPLRPLKEFLDSDYSPSLILEEELFKRYEDCINVVDSDNHESICICFTKGYYRCRLASGSMIRLQNGQVRRFSSKEILRLFGFSQRYQFPIEISEEKAASLLGNAVDVRAIRHILEQTLLPSVRAGKKPGSPEGKPGDSVDACTSR
jgi:DNA (cytosine-5)-methyltransferase 1